MFIDRSILQGSAFLWLLVGAVATSTQARANGACGPADGIAVATAPISGLCRTGMPSVVAGRGPWSWSCTGDGNGRSAICLAPLLASSGPYPRTTLHYAPGSNIDASGTYAPGIDGFTLADVDDVQSLDSLPTGVLGLVWLGLCNGADAGFVRTVAPFAGDARLYGFYLMDEPDPTGKNKAVCPAANLKAEADWVRANIPGAKTFIVLMNLGASSFAPSFANSYTPLNTDIDLFGLDPYPCRSELHGCGYRMIDAYVAAAQIAGIPPSAIVPVYQAFGGGSVTDNGGGHYALPTAGEELRVFAVWAALVGFPAFDYAYSWGVQDNDRALSTTPALQAVFREKNAGP